MNNTERIDLPNRKAGLLVKLAMRNGGIGQDKREKHFPELTTAELDDLEALVRQVLDEHPLPVGLGDAAALG